MADQIVTRFPPSPTGNLHMGSARTALFNYLFARKHDGKIILRFEDTDKIRSKKEFESNIFESLEWLSFRFDQIYKQSERTLVYRKYIEKMIAEKTAYISSEEVYEEDLFREGESEDTEEVKKSGHEQREIIRFRNPNKKVIFTDTIRGEITVDTTELNDFIIARGLEDPLYHLAAVIDDFEMGVTHVIRGEDGIYNTPRQILLQEAIGAPRPVYCHIPFVFGSDKSKLSKRHGAVSVTEYRDQGFLPEALINYLALLGWNPGDNREIFTLAELLEIFDLKGIQKSGAVFDLEKFRWINREHVKKLSVADFKTFALQFLPAEIKNLPLWQEERFERLLPELRERTVIFTDVTNYAKDGELDYFFSTPIYDKELLLPKTKTAKPPSVTILKKHLKYIIEALSNIAPEEWKPEKVKGKLWDYATNEGRGEVLWPMRIALSGREKSPDPFTIAYILGKEETTTRLNSAITILSAKNE